MGIFNCPFCNHSVISTGSVPADQEADYMIGLHIESRHPEKTEEEIEEAYLPSLEEIQKEIDRLEEEKGKSEAKRFGGKES